MARPIKETPILFGEDAKRFERRMQERRKISAAEKAIMAEHYRIGIEALYRSEEERKRGILPPGVVLQADC